MFNFFEKNANKISIIATLVTLFAVIFSMGVFYNRFNSLEKNIDLKIDMQKESIQYVSGYQKNLIDYNSQRISQLEQIVIDNLESISSNIDKLDMKTAMMSDKYSIVRSTSERYKNLDTCSKCDSLKKVNK